MYLEGLLPKVKNNEVRGMLLSFASREFEHQLGYSMVGTTLGFPDSYWTEYLEFVETKAKDDFMASWNPEDNYGLRLAKNIVTEGESLNCNFAILRSFELRGLMLGMATVNDWSILDENTHTEGLIALFRTWAEENPKEINDAFKKKIYKLFRYVVNLEDNFIDFVMKDYKIDGINIEDLKTYARLLADRRSVAMGLKANYQIKDNPLKWMDDLISSDTSSNFFEVRATDYSIAGMTGKFLYN